MAKVDFDAFKKLNPIKDIIIENQSIEDGIDPSAPQKTDKEKAVEFSNMSQKDKKELQNSDPERFIDLYTAFQNNL